MAEQAIGMGLQAVPIVSQHYHKVWDPVRNKYKEMIGEAPRDDPDVHDHRTMEEKGYVLRKRSQVARDEEIVDTVRHRGEVKDRRPSRPGMNRRPSSMNDADYNYDRRGYGGGYESEGSVPPRSRTRARSQGGKSQKRGSSTSSSSSSDPGSSSDDEKQCKKAQRKKWITAGLASVATIHAASKVYSSIEAHDKRIIEVEKGTMSPEEAHKKQRNARWQDAAAIAIAALGIKGAISEWNEVQEEHKEHMEAVQRSKEHHQKRLERQRREKARGYGGYYKGRDGQYYYDGPEGQNSERSRSRQLDGPRNGDRKMLEGPGASSRGRSAYGDDRYSSQYADSNRSRSRYAADPRRRSRYADDYDDDY